MCGVVWCGDHFFFNLSKLITKLSFLRHLSGSRSRAKRINFQSLRGRPERAGAARGELTICWTGKCGGAKEEPAEHYFERGRARDGNRR